MKALLFWVTQVGGDHAITPFYNLTVDFKNVKENSAKHGRYLSA